MKAIFSLLALYLLFGCTASTQIKPDADSQELSSVQHIQLAEAARKRFYESFLKEDLNTAIFHFKQVADRHPHNVSIQRIYYENIFFRDLFNTGEPSPELVKTFSAMNVLLKQNLNPPSYMAYLALKEDTEHLAKREAIVKSAIQDQPFSARLWHVLSEVYEKKKQYWLALAAAKRANELAADVPEYMYQLGDTLNDIMALSECPYDETKYRKTAIQYIAKAAKKQPNQLYYDNLGLHYLRIGLFPLAYQSAKQAFELEVNAWTALHYAQASFLLQRYDEVSLALKKGKTATKEDIDLDLSAALAWQRGERAQAIAILQNSNNQHPNILNQLKINWLMGISGEQVDHRQLADLKHNSTWQATIGQFISKKQPKKALLDIATNGCQKTEAYFYMAYNAWINRDLENAKNYLQQVRQQPATLYTEYYWAPILLKNL